MAGVITVYIAGLYEWQNGAVTKYYEGGAIRRTGYATDNGAFYVVSDHLRSTSVLVNRDGTVKSRNFYYPYGGNRGGSAFSGITTKRFTGQYHEQGLPGGEGLSYYNARWYDAQVGLFISADTLVPVLLAPQALNRFAYVGGNPLRFGDPSGHACDDGPQTWAACYGKKTTNQTVIQAANRPGGPGTTTLPQARDKGLPYPPYYLFNEKYGWIDRGHALPGLAYNVISLVTQKVIDGGGPMPIPPQAAGPLIGGKALVYYERTYWISPKVTPDQIVGVALGIYEDAGRRWEEWQGGFPIGTSRYALEDLPSNYLGFVRAANGWSESYAYSFLGKMNAVGAKVQPHCAWGNCQGSSQPKLPNNYEHQPLVLSGGQWVHVAWPNELQITPISSSADTWLFQSDATSGILAPFHKNKR